MKKILVFTLLCSVVTLTLNIAPLKSHGFNSISTPDGINILTAGDSGKILISSNSGSTWLYRFTSPNKLNSVYSYNSYFWIAGDQGNIYKVNVNDWNIITISTGISVNLNSVYFTNENTGYVCGDAGKVYKTVNGGINWVEADYGIPVTGLNSIAFKDINYGFTAGNNGRIYKTLNGGLNWTPEISNTNNNLLKINFSGDNIFCSGEYGTLLKKSSGSWISIDTRTKSDIRSISSDNQNIVHICGGAGFIRNNKNGDSDFLKFEYNPLLSDLSDIYFFNSSLGFAVSSENNAVIKTVNGGQNWDFANNVTIRYLWESKITGQVNGYGNTLCRHPFDRNTIFVGFTDKIFVSRDKGNTWNVISVISNLSQIYRMSAFFVSAADTNVWLACVNLSTDCPLIRTTDYGISWNIVLNNTEVGDYSHPLEMDENIPGTFYFAPISNGFFKSTDNGNTFNKICNYNFNNVCDMAVQYNNSANILLADASYPSLDSGTMYKSTNGGLSWQEKYKVLDPEIPTVENSIFNYNKAYLASYKYYTSNDYGESWNGETFGFDALWALDECKEDASCVFTSRFSGRGYLSTNGGSDFSWINFPSNSIFLSAVLYPERDYVIGMFNSSVYKLKFYFDVNVGIENNSGISANGFSLYQNYPNPFNPVTKIKYLVPMNPNEDKSNVKLIIYNNLGMEVKTLVNQYQKAGSYEVEFNGANLASGVYFYQILIQSDRSKSVNFNQTRKMILLK